MNLKYMLHNRASTCKKLTYFSSNINYAGIHHIIDHVHEKQHAQHPGHLWYSIAPLILLQVDIIRTMVLHTWTEFVSGKSICFKPYLLSSDNNTRFTLDHHVFCASKKKTSWCKSTRLIEVLHDGSNLFRLVLEQEAGNINMRTEGWEKNRWVIMWTQGCKIDDTTTPCIFKYTIVNSVC